ncbi:MAG: type Z 30S ribosomal protein S14 [Fimbriimonadales bacterium]|jgi:small subunit ribosomal protein S14|nr:type Z 30S ribosomal protein S14 [Armatimonadota bacterium]
MPTTAWIEKAKKKPKFKVRRVNRCSICGRSRGYIRYFGICRICLREQAHKGVLPGVRKSSW